VAVDAGLMTRAWTELLAGALELTPRGGHVLLRGAIEGLADHGLARVDLVCDGARWEGDGVEEILDRFSPLLSADLSWVLDVFLLHGGTLAVSGEPEVSFTLSLPTLSGAQSAPDGVFSEQPMEEGSAATDVRPTVLVVEDDPGQRALLRHHLEPRYEVLEAEDGLQALDMVLSRPPDLILADVMMPVLDGLSLCRTIKTDATTSHIPVVLLTAKAAREHRWEGFQAGADEYVSKPVEWDELLMRIRNLLATVHRIRAHQRALPSEWPAVVLRPVEGAIDAPAREFLEAAYSAIKERLDDPDLSVDVLAAAVFTSRSNLYRRFEAILGRSPMDVVWQVRMEQASLMLRKSAEPVTEIAYAVGFKSVAHFSRRFKSHFGMPPSTFRSHYQGAEGPPGGDDPTDPSSDPTRP